MDQRRSAVRIDDYIWRQTKDITATAIAVETVADKSKPFEGFVIDTNEDSTTSRLVLCLPLRIEEPETA